VLVQILNQELVKRAKKNPAYSLRAFAKSLNMDSSTLSSLLRNKRPLSAKMASKILKILDIDESQKKEIFLASLARGVELKDKTQFQNLDEDVFEAISSWEHFAILSLLTVKGFRPNVKAIGARLNIGTGVVIDALRRLEKLGLIAKENGVLKVTNKNLTTTHEMPSRAVREANKQYIEKALYSLEHHSVEDRDMTGITMAVSKKKLKEAKKIIKKFRREICETLEDEETDDVYRLNVQLFPLGK
jgi:uncharacterized protein (TIGR02147 family)